MTLMTGSKAKGHNCMEKTGGYDEINQDLLEALKDINLTDAAHVLDLGVMPPGRSR